MEIKTLNILRGELPAKVRGLVEEWGEIHNDELLQIWETGEFRKVAPWRGTAVLISPLKQYMKNANNRVYLAGNSSS